MIDKIRSVLEVHAFKELSELPDGVSGYVRIFNRKGEAMLLVSHEGLDNLTRESYLEIVGMLKESLKVAGCTDTEVLTVFVTTALAKCTILAEGTAFWIVTSRGRMIIRPGQPEEFAGIREEIETEIVPESVHQATERARAEAEAVEKLDKSKPVFTVDHGFFRSPANSLPDCKITFIILGLNVVMYLLQCVVGDEISLYGRIDKMTLWLGGNDTRIFNHYEYYRLITQMFLHGGAFHLISNMVVFLMVGTYCERMFSRRFYLFTYMCGGIIASLTSAIANMLFPYSYRGTRVSVYSVGASGAIAAVIGLTLIRLFLSGAFTKMASDGWSTNYIIFFVVAVLWFSKEFFMQEGSAGTDVSAHLGGFLSGAVFGLALVFWLYYKQSKDYYA